MSAARERETTKRNAAALNASKAVEDEDPIIGVLVGYLPYEPSKVLENIFDLLFRQEQMIGKRAAYLLDTHPAFSDFQKAALAELQKSYQVVHDCAKSYKDYLENKLELIEPLAAKTMLFEKHKSAAQIHHNKVDLAVKKFSIADTYKRKMQSIVLDVRVNTSQVFHLSPSEKVMEDLELHAKAAKETFSKAHKKYLAELGFHMVCEGWHKTQALKLEKQINSISKEKAAIEKKLTMMKAYLTALEGNKQVKDISVAQYRERFCAAASFAQTNDLKKILEHERKPITDKFRQSLEKVGKIVFGAVAKVITALDYWNDTLFKPKGYGVFCKMNTEVKKITLGSRSVS